MLNLKSTNSDQKTSLIFRIKQLEKENEQLASFDRKRLVDLTQLQKENESIKEELAKMKHTLLEQSKDRDQSFLDRTKEVFDFQMTPQKQLFGASEEELLPTVVHQDAKAEFLPLILSPPSSQRLRVITKPPIKLFSKQLSSHRAQPGREVSGPEAWPHRDSRISDSRQIVLPQFEHKPSSGAIRGSPHLEGATAVSQIDEIDRLAEERAEQDSFYRNYLRFKKRIEDLGSNSQTDNRSLPVIKASSKAGSSRWQEPSRGATPAAIHISNINAYSMQQHASSQRKKTHRRTPSDWQAVSKEASDWSIKKSFHSQSIHEHPVFSQPFASSRFKEPHPASKPSIMQNYQVFKKRLSKPFRFSMERGIPSTHLQSKQVNRLSTEQNEDSDGRRSPIELFESPEK